MADNLRLTRFNKFYGGITVADRSRSDGVCLNIEELDPFKSRDYIIPQTIFQTNSFITNETSGFTLDDGDNIYTATRGAANKLEIYKRASASQAVPSTPASIKVSSGNFKQISPIMWHKLTSGSAYLYYVTDTNTLRRSGALPAVTETTVGTLTGITGVANTFDRIPQIRTNGELYIGNGQYIANVDDTGTFVEKFASLYSGWVCVSFARSSNLLAILARSPILGDNKCKVFFWDFSQNPDSMIDEVDIPMGGPQIIENHNETLRVICAKNGIMKAYALDGRRAALTHTLYNVQTETDTHPIIPNQSKFIKDNIMYFAIWKTDKTGLYAIGRVDEQAPAALILAKRFATTDYSLHKPHAAISAGPNWFASFMDNTTERVVNVFDENSPTRSSQAIYESIWYDAGNPEVSKSWVGFILNTTPVASGVSVAVSARVDNASSYDTASLQTLSSANDQLDSGGTADTNWIRPWVSLVGRTLGFKLAFTSNATAYAKLYQISLIHRDGLIENL